MPALITKRQAIDLLRRISQQGLTNEDLKKIRILATQLQKEIDNHNEIAKRSRDRQKNNLTGALQWLKRNP